MDDSKKESSVNPDEWTFDVKVKKDNEGNVEEVRKPVKKSINEVQKKRKKETLTLDDKPRESLTRRQMADKLADDKKEDIIQCAHPVKRIIAGVIDSLVIFFGYFCLKFLIVPTYLVAISFADHYKLEFYLSQNDYKKYGLYVVIFLSFFIFQVVLQAFYNRTVGKYFLGISIRNDESFTLKISDVFVREIIFKPLSLVSVIGILMSFFNKNRKMLHDLLAKTLVIE